MNKYKEDKDMAKKILRCLLIMVSVVAMIVLMAYVAVGAVLQESYKITPPTAEEVAENPKLAVYLKGE